MLVFFTPFGVGVREHHILVNSEGLTRYFTEQRGGNESKRNEPKNAERGVEIEFKISGSFSGRDPSPTPVDIGPHRQRTKRVTSNRRGPKIWVGCGCQVQMTELSVTNNPSVTNKTKTDE